MKMTSDSSLCVSNNEYKIVNDHGSDNNDDDDGDDNDDDNDGDDDE